MEYMWAFGCMPYWSVLCRKLHLLWKGRIVRSQVLYELWTWMWRWCSRLRCVGRSVCFSAPFPRRQFSSSLTLFSFISYRCLLHCNFIILVESHSHHPGELPSPLRPEVPETKVFSPKLFEAYIVGLLSSHTRDKHCTWLGGRIM